MEHNLHCLTFPTYESASLRSIPTLLSASITSDENERGGCEETFNIFSVENIRPVLAATMGLLKILLSHYAVVPIVLYLLSISRTYELPLGGATSLILPTVALICSIQVAVSLYHRPISHVSGKIGFNSVGATTNPGLHYKLSGNMAKILRGCPILAASTTILGSLPNLAATPWIFSGDMRTLLPFLSFKTKTAKYVRRWIRVPLADGPIGMMNNEDASFCSDKSENSFEAVALDCSFANPRDTKKIEISHNDTVERNSIDKDAATKLKEGVSKGVHEESGPIVHGEKVEIKKDFVLLILAGLTGGSDEGYVLDLVDAANQTGVDCYVMLGRGLGGTPNLSDSSFHGARTTDVREASRILRKSLPKKTKIFVVGVSMGGIIVTNAIGRSVLTDTVDGAIAVSGCFDTAKNIKFTHSRTFWQPLLNFGLKKAFVSPPGALKKLSRRMGPMAKAIVDKTKDVINFDSCVVTAMHRFRDVYHYYSDMCGCSDQRLSSLLSSTEPLPELDVPLVSLERVLIDSRATESSPERLMPEKSSSVEALNLKTTPEAVKDAKAICDTGNTRATTPSVPCPPCGLPVPLLSIHAADDPIIHVDTLPCLSGLATSLDNLVCLVTCIGGHVGWPLGWRPWTHRWKFQNTLILEFCEAVTAAKSTLDKEE